MAKCVHCGKRGLFLRVDSNGLCDLCAERARRDALMVSQEEAARVKVVPTTAVSAVVFHPKSASGEVTTTYRSPLASARRGLFYCVGDPDMYSYSEDDFLLSIFLMYYAGWSFSDCDNGAYDMKMLFPRPTEELSALDRLGWIIPPDAQSSLEKLTIPDLKAFCDAHNLENPKGKKADMIEHILDTAPSSLLEKYAAAHRYVMPSDLGYHVLRSLYNERIALELSVSDALAHGTDADALAIAKEYRKRRPVMGSTIQDLMLSVPRTSDMVCLVIACRLLGVECMTKVFAQYYIEHPDAVMHDGIASYFPNLALLASFESR